MTETLPNNSANNPVANPQNKTTKLCQSCKKSIGELLRCSKCKKVYYCNIQCQKLDWIQHKRICCKENTQQEDQNSTNKKTKQEGLNQFGKLTHIGTGNFSIVYKAISKNDGKVYAIKQVEKAKVQRMRKQADVLMQKHCLTKLKDCPYVIKLYKTFQDELSLYFQMQFPEKGQLWQISKTFGVIPNSIFKYYASHIVKAISILHNQYQIVHRDLKPQNILLDSTNRIKLIDFGTAKDLDRPDIKGAGNGLKGKKQFEHYVGTAHYMAPQCIHNKASQKISDIYSLSGIFYFLKVGSPPFQGGSQYLTFTKSLQTQLLTCPELFDQKIADLIHKMNCKQMKNRIDINQVMAHQYFEGVDFGALNTYQQALQSVTQQQAYLVELCTRLKALMQKENEPKVQRRRQIYQKQIKPIITQQLQKLTKQQERNILIQNHVKIIDIQCQCFLNTRDNNNISFTQIYSQVNRTNQGKAQQVIMSTENNDSKKKSKSQRVEAQLQKNQKEKEEKDQEEDNDKQSQSD